VAELGVSPPTYEAYRAFTKGMEHFLREEFGPAIPCLEQAIALDPGFTRAMLMAAAAHANLGQWERVGPLLEALEAVAERLSPFEAGALRWHQARLAGDREATYAAASLGWRRYPGTVAHFLAGLSALEASRPRQTVEIFRTLDPERGWLRQFHRYWDVLTAAHHALGEHVVELEAARRGRRRFPLLLAGLAWEVRALAAAGQVASLEERLWEASELPPQHGWSCVGVWLMAAAELRAHGGGPLAAAWAERALERARRHSEAGPLTAPPRSELAFALCAAERWQEAQGLFRRLAAQSPRDLDLKGRLGVLAARRGEVREASSADRALRECRRPYLFGRHTLWRARIAALLGHGTGAVELLQGAFAEGLAFGLELHSDPDLEPLRAHPRFQALVRPRG
jgi:tetratricopeptide (TPR) repeat protein